MTPAGPARTSQIAGLVALLLALPLAATAQPRPRLAVMQIDAGKGVDPASTRVLDDFVLTQFSRTGHFASVIGEQDIVSMIQLEEERAKITGCVDESCLAEIGGALGVDYVFFANVGQLGSKTLVNAKLVKVQQIRVVGRGSEVVPPDEEALIGATRHLVRELCAQAFPSSGVQSAVAWSSAGVAAASLVTGAILGGLALADQETLADTEANDPDLGGLRDRLRSEGLAADVLFGVGAAAAVVSLVLFLLDDDGAAGSAVSVSPASRGGITAGVQF